MHKSPQLAVAGTSVDDDRIKALANHLQLPLCSQTGSENLPACDHFDFFLVYQTSEHNERQLSMACPSGELGSPFFIDFTHGQLAHRRQYGGGRGQPLARAVGLKGGINPTVVDATAGMGRDAFVLAALGCEVTLIERSPILAALLQDALNRALDDTELDNAIPARMLLVEANAIHWLQHCTEEDRPDVVYLDPMYPHRSKSALVKKEMRVLRALVGDDDDASELLQAALGCARKRVVVKRPKSAPPVIPADQPDKRPAAAVASKNTRYDIYPIIPAGKRA